MTMNESPPRPTMDARDVTLIRNALRELGRYGTRENLELAMEADAALTRVVDGPRPHQLAADVRADALIAECESHAAVLSMPHTPFQVEQSVNFLVATVPHVVRALVARITDLEAQLADAAEHLGDLVQFGEATARARAAEAQVLEAIDSAVEYKKRAEAAEAQVAALQDANDALGQRRDWLQQQVAALTQDRDEWKLRAESWLDATEEEIFVRERRERERAEAAEAALATTRQAVDRQLRRHLCYTSEASRERFWKDVDADLARRALDT